MLELKDGVEPDTEPDVTEPQFLSGFTVTGVAQQASSFGTGKELHGHAGQLGPPQSIPISWPFKMPSVQLGQLEQFILASHPDLTTDPSDVH